MPITRRQLAPLSAGALLAVSRLSAAESGGPVEKSPVRGGRMIVGQFPEPPLLTAALTVAGPTQLVSTKISDGLLSYDFDLKPVPQLATNWTVSPDGLTIVFRLRDGVRWHDGQPFTSEDVAYSVLEVWKKYHSRGRSTFANVITVDTPDKLTAIWRLSAPAPYILNALAAGESTVVAKHLYAGTDIQANPLNDAPVGTGPFRFERWEKGEYISLTRVRVDYILDVLLV